MVKCNLLLTVSVTTVFLILVGFETQHVLGFQAVECKDGNIMGIKELVDTVEHTVNECTNKTSSKADLFGCIFKELDMFGKDDKPTAEKIKGFFEKVFTSKIMTQAKELTKNLMTCAEDYAKSFQQMKSMADLGKSGDAFANCFFDATKKFTYFVRNECKPTEMKMAPSTTSP